MKRVALPLLLAAIACGGDSATNPSPATLEAGKAIFRFDTFGDETFWTDTLRLHEVVETVSPATALAVGLKVDADMLPAEVLQAIQAGQVDLNDPATTVTLLKLGAVVGLKATVDAGNHVTSLGTTCALCHSTVDNRIAPGIGSRLDAWPNLELNPGAIIALSPALTAEQKAVYNSWGPGKFDPRTNFDGLNGAMVVMFTTPARAMVMPSQGVRTTVPSPSRTSRSRLSDLACSSRSSAKSSRGSTRGAATTPTVHRFESSWS